MLVVDRQRANPGGVMHIFFCSAFVLSEGQSLMGSLSAAGIKQTWFDISPDQLEMKRQESRGCLLQ